MYTNDVVKFMDDINTVLSFIASALNLDEIVNFRLEDQGDKIAFYIQRGDYKVDCASIRKLDAESLKVIYASIVAKYKQHMEVGATSLFENGEVTWNLAPVIGNNTLIEFISSDKKDQEWFYEEIENSTKVKGL